VSEILADSEGPMSFLNQDLTTVTIRWKFANGMKHEVEFEATAVEVEYPPTRDGYRGPATYKLTLIEQPRRYTRSLP
jgi:hypothetical protein